MVLSAITSGDGPAGTTSATTAVAPGMGSDFNPSQRVLGPAAITAGVGVCAGALEENIGAAEPINKTRNSLRIPNLLAPSPRQGLTVIGIDRSDSSQPTAFLLAAILAHKKPAAQLPFDDHSGGVGAAHNR